MSDDLNHVPDSDVEHSSDRGRADIASNDLKPDHVTDPIDSDADESLANDFDDDDLSEEPLDDWGGGELEAAYLKALAALEASDSEMLRPVESAPSAEDDHLEREVVYSEDADSDLDERSVSAASNDIIAHEMSIPVDTIQVDSFDRVPDRKKSNAPPAESQQLTESTIPPTPREIIEACLFVGGSPLTAKRLSGVLRGEFDTDFVEREIDALNRLYAAENRPYEIQMGEGGFRLTLREEFERIRHKVYGLGPKEVRLSQEALEVLAVVAYHQPIKQSRVEELGKPGCGPVLRQLVRRELIAVERDPAHPRDVNYKTTPRFLSLFDIRSLDELPRHEQVGYK